jgi:hypothetical protein
MLTLTRAEVFDFENAIFATFAAQSAVRAAHPLASRIKFPGVPAPFSENIVLLAASKLFPRYKGYIPSLGGKLADVILSPPLGGITVPSMSPPPIVKVEVKATASRGTLELKPRDVRADILVWLTFGDRFEGGKDAITVYVLLDPKENALVQSVAGRVVKLPAFIAAAHQSPGFAKHVHQQLSTLI